MDLRVLQLGQHSITKKALKTKRIKIKNMISAITHQFLALKETASFFFQIRLWYMEAGTTMIKRGGKASPVLIIRATSMRFRGGINVLLVLPVVLQTEK
jgi:hypothetical protein